MIEMWPGLSCEEEARLRRELNAATAKAYFYQRDWYDTKSQYGTVMAQAREKIRVLQAALRHVAEHCIADPDLAQFAARAADGSARIDDPLLGTDRVEIRISIMHTTGRKVVQIVTPLTEFDHVGMETSMTYAWESLQREFVTLLAKLNGGNDG